MVDKAAYACSVDVQVVNLDVSDDDVLSRIELRRTLKSFHLLSCARFRSSTLASLPVKVVMLYYLVVEQFYGDCNGTVDRTKF
jgi:hypothetical protein